jgi:hypothetical protein
VSLANVTTPSVISDHGFQSSTRRTSPDSSSMISNPFHSVIASSRSSASHRNSVLQKLNLMKDALLDKTQTPVLAMWKGGAAAFPNRGTPYTQKEHLDGKIFGLTLTYSRTPAVPRSERH